MTRWDPQVKLSHWPNPNLNQSSFTGSCFEDRCAVFCVCEWYLYASVFCHKKTIFSLQTLESQKFHFAGQLVFRKAIRKSGKSPVDFPGFLMTFLLILTFQKENHLSKTLNAFFILIFNPFYRHLLGKVQTFFVLPYRIQQKLEDLLSSIPDYSIPYRIQQ